MNSPVDVLAALDEFALKRNPFGSTETALDRYTEAREAMAEVIAALKLARKRARGFISDCGPDTESLPEIDAALARVQP